MLRDVFYWNLGIVILFLNKIRYTLRGYRTPRPFAVTDVAKVIAYDNEVVDRWQKILEEHGVAHPFVDKDVLELGPGADLGNALLLIERGAKSYTAIDANNLITQAPQHLYDAFFESMQNPAAAKTALEAFQRGEPSSIRFVHDAAFNFAQLPSSSIDLVLSNAAFEHFDNVPRVLQHVDRVVRPGGMLCIHVDLQTHTRVIRDRDPLNIYRFPEWLYSKLHFTGIPNRVRPATYEKTLRVLGWRDIFIMPVTEIPTHDVSKLASGVHQSFRHEGEGLRTLSFMLFARKP